jgi:predicted DNA-binding transcriptional regulator AlpA
MSNARDFADTRLVLTANEAAALFCKQPRTWRRWDAAGKIPRPVSIGRARYWRLEELKAWIDAGCPRRAAWENMRQNQ